MMTQKTIKTIASSGGARAIRRPRETILKRPSETHSPDFLVRMVGKHKARSLDTRMMLRPRRD
jgi:hypothetical protein